jgi:hypothetical protein
MSKTGIFVRPNLCGVDDENGKVRSVRHARHVR